MHIKIYAFNAIRFIVISKKNLAIIEIKCKRQHYSVLREDSNSERIMSVSFAVPEISYVINLKKRITS